MQIIIFRINLKNNRKVFNKSKENNFSISKKIKIKSIKIFKNTKIDLNLFNRKRYANKPNLYPKNS
jgi:hypothetical protein